MMTFKQFMEASGTPKNINIGGNDSRFSRALQGNWGSPGNLTLMGTRQRSILDPNNKAQQMEKYTQILSNVFSDCTVGRFWPCSDEDYGHGPDRNKILYTSLEINPTFPSQALQGESEQSFLISEGILKKATQPGFDEAIIKDGHLDPEEVIPFLKGDLPFDGPPGTDSFIQRCRTPKDGSRPSTEAELSQLKTKLIKPQGFYFDAAVMKQIPKKIEHYAFLQKELQGAANLVGHAYGSAMGAANRGILPSISKGVRI